MKIRSEQEMLEFGKEFAKQLQDENRLNAVIELIGDVGAGKTTFTRGLAMGLGITKPVTSPSFTVSKSYAFRENHVLTHYDFYRLEDPGLMSEDLQDSIKNNHLVIVEWANTIQNVLLEDRIKITIALEDDGTRNIELFEGSEQGLSRPAPPRPPSRGSVAELPPLSQTVSKNPILNPGKASMFLDTSTSTTILKLNEKEYVWESKNNLAEKLLQFIYEKLQENNKTWQDIGKITFMSGPGSFTGLRIGASVVNALAHELNIPLYDHHGKEQKIILPDYGREANITKPKK